MHTFFRRSATAFLVISFVISLVPQVRPCGPSSLVPVFENDRSPDYPYSGFADGKLGIVSPKYPKIVLFAAYRYLNGNNFSAGEREELAQAWSDFFNRSTPNRKKVTDAIKAWIAERASVVGDEEKPPEIYAERPYGDIGYEFFPNCAEDAFVVARDTLSDRAISHGSTDKYVQEWIRGQDAVFTNCGDSKTSPAPPSGSMPEWLQKDRAYQSAAAAFYSMNYQKAKQMFADIAKDPDSPWQEVSEYLVPRTLIRQASLSGSEPKNKQIYVEAEQALDNISAGGGKYAQAADRLLGLVKYRLHPRERVQELAQDLSYYGGGNLKQDLIDYTWLLAKFEAEALKNEEDRKKQAAANGISPNSNSNIPDITSNVAINLDPEQAEKNRIAKENTAKGLVQIYVYNDDYSESWPVWIDPAGTDGQAMDEAAKVVGELTDKMKETLRNARKSAYQQRFDSRSDEFEGRYYGPEESSLKILPAFLLADDLTDWLFTFQLEGDAAYDHSLLKFRQTNSDAWLVSALVKANAGSNGLASLLDSARSVPVTSPAYPTAAYYRAKLLAGLGKNVEAKQALDDAINSSVDMPLSARNELSAIRMKLADTLEDFLHYSLRKPYAFEWAGEYLSVDQMIAQEKSYYNSEYYKETREEYDRSIDEKFRFAKEIENEPMLDEDSIKVMNYHFPMEELLRAEASTVVPDYLRGRLALVIWTRSVLLGDWQTADYILPEVRLYHPEMENEMKQFAAAKTASQKKSAGLFAIVKNDRISPYIASGFGSPMESISYGFRWWCEPYDEEWDDKSGQMVKITIQDRPAFLTESQSKAALQDMKKLKAIGDAPKFLATQVMEWATVDPGDQRVPEALYLVWQANDWDKYGCGGDPVGRGKIKELMMKKYPSNRWTQKMLSEEIQ